MIFNINTYIFLETSNEVVNVENGMKRKTEEKKEKKGKKFIKKNMK